MALLRTLGSQLLWPRGLRPIQSLSRTTTSLSKTYSAYPDEVLLQPPPPPPRHPLPDKPYPVKGPQSSYHLQESEDDDKLRQKVRELSKKLKLCHRQPIDWPVDQAQESDCLNVYISNILISPIVQLFNQLRHRSMDLITYKVDTIEDGCAYRATFEVEKSVYRVAPVLLFEISATGHSQSAMVLSAQIEDQMRRVWEKNAKTNIILTDLKSITIFSSPTPTNPSKVIYERFNGPDTLTALRVIIAAYLHDSLPIDFTDSFFKEERVIPHGVPKDPDKPLTPDQQLFPTCHRHSDFDIYTISHDRASALQFLRWKAYVKERVPQRFARPGETLSGWTLAFTHRHGEWKPCYPLRELPSETINYISTIKRPLPPHSEGLFDALKSSNTFVVNLVDDLTVSSEWGGRSRVSTCTLTSIDDQGLTSESPLLVLKLVDDRFYPLSFTTEDLAEWDVEECFAHFDSAESLVHREDAAYERLHFLQGSLIPHYYGAHQFVLPNGHRLFGMLMEYIPAPSILGGIAKSLTVKQQHQLVKSARHFVYALQRSDTPQRDWHPGQVLCRTLTSSAESSINSRDVVHGVFIDFGSAGIHAEEHAWSLSDDFGDCLYTLKRPEVGLDNEVLWESFASTGREPWDLWSSQFKVGDTIRWIESHELFEKIFLDRTIHK
ncbi:hypothetical protein BDN72DRAFT_958036 [Pluteus cervinus]|uniref:Uncharacterized protein n=1 Tax=Pluteus cervinus TaxID=181527 RepID=A0ACD3B1I6_9AGAR|nr:hypothetical protein BDN72DRAFT_958036 [Pluteus cervinus]